MRPSSHRLLAIALLLQAACGPDAGPASDPCSPGETRCLGQLHQACSDGVFVDVQLCELPAMCHSAGCLECEPGQPTCVGSQVHACVDGTIGDLLEDCPLGCVEGACLTEGCAADAVDNIFLVSAVGNLFSFNPATSDLSYIGRMECPAGPALSWWDNGPSHPFSMSVDRTGRAWVLYTSGEIFWVDTITVECTPSTYQPKQLPAFELFGMGFAAAAPGSEEDVLFLSGALPKGQPQPSWPWGARLGRLDPATLLVSEVGPLPPTIVPELTGTSQAELFGFAPPDTAMRLDPATGALLQSWDAPDPGSENLGGYAFAHWGGRLFTFQGYDFDESGGIGTAVSRLDPTTGQGEIVATFPSLSIVGAGVSTCAPVVVP
jgi:hypothetical protein